MKHDSTSIARSRRLGRVGRWFLIAAVVYLTSCTALYFQQDQMVFPTHMTPPARSGVPYLGGEALQREIETGGNVEAWFIPPTDAPAPLAVICHGNADLIDFHHQTAKRFRDMGFAVLLPEYRGYGRSAGKPSQETIRRDLIAWVDQIAARSDVDASRLVYHGMSLGGGVAADLAAERKPTVLILQSTFTSIIAMSRRYLVPPFIVRHPYRTDRIAPQLGIPVAVFHGTHDEIIPVSHGRRLAKIIPNATYHEYDSRHNDFPGRGNEDAYWDAVETFLKETSLFQEIPMTTASTAER